MSNKKIFFFRDRIDEARQELHRIVGDREMKDAVLLVFANKQDLPNGWFLSIPFSIFFLFDETNVFCLKIKIAMSPAEITDKLGLHRMRDRNWFVQPSCATSGDGLFEGL